MTDPTDTLIITFQTQLADVMETVLKTAMFEVSRLVEEGFLEEVRRRKQEVESLQSQLQKAERELSDEGGGEERNTRRMRCVDCCKPTVAPSSPMEGAKDKLSQSDIDVLKRCGLKQEEDFEDRWTESCGPEVMFESVLELDHSLSSPLKVFGEEQKTNLDLKVEDEEEEEEAMLSCIADHHRTWTLTEHSSEGPEEPSYLGPADRQELQHHESQERWGVAAACDPPPPGHSLREDGLLEEGAGDGRETRAVRPGGEEFRFTSGGTEAATSGQARAVRPDCVTRTRTSPSRPGRGPTGAGGKADGAPPGPHPYPLLLPGPISSPAESPTGRLRVSPLGSAAIKEEIIIDSDEEEEKVAKREEESARSESPRPRPLYRVRPEVAKQNHLSQKSPLHGTLKHKLKSTNSLSGPSLHHPHRPVRKQPHPLPTNGAASSAGPQLVPPLSPFRTSSAPKPSPPSLALQRAFPGARRPSPLGLTHSHWASFKNHHQGSPSFAHPHALPGGRRLLCCGQCGKCFPHPSNLKAHQRTHTGERPFSCSLCGRTFTKISNLKAHRRVHTGERPYSCSACGKRFTQKCNLKRHQRIHLDNVL